MGLLDGVLGGITQVLVAAASSWNQEVRSKNEGQEEVAKQQIEAKGL